LKGVERPPLHMRVFKVDWPAFISNLARATGGSETNSVRQHQIAFMELLTSRNIDLSPPNGRNVFFNTNEGTVMIRATVPEVEEAEKLIQELGSRSQRFSEIDSPQINIKTTFVLIPEKNMGELFRSIGI